MFLIELALTVLLYLVELVFTVLPFRTELALTVLLFCTELVHTAILLNLQSSRHSGRMNHRKNNARVRVQECDMDLASHMGSAQKDSTKYDLYAVCNHIGNIGGGHYTAYARHKAHGKWAHYNDERCSEATGKEVCENNQHAYVLFFSRKTEEDNAKARASSRTGNDMLVHRQSLSLPELWPHRMSCLNDDALQSFMHDLQNDDGHAASAATSAKKSAGNITKILQTRASSKSRTTATTPVVRGGK